MSDIISVIKQKSQYKKEITEAYEKIDRYEELTPKHLDTIIKYSNVSSDKTDTFLGEIAKKHKTILEKPISISPEVYKKAKTITLDDLIIASNYDTHTKLHLTLKNPTPPILFGDDSWSSRSLEGIIDAKVNNLDTTRRNFAIYTNKNNKTNYENIDVDTKVSKDMLTGNIDAYLSSSTAIFKDKTHQLTINSLYEYADENLKKDVLNSYSEYQDKIAKLETEKYSYINEQAHKFAKNDPTEIKKFFDSYNALNDAITRENLNDNYASQLVKNLNQNSIIFKDSIITQEQVDILKDTFAYDSKINNQLKDIKSSLNKEFSKDAQIFFKRVYEENKLKQLDNDKNIVDKVHVSLEVKSNEDVRKIAPELNAYKEKRTFSFKESLKDFDFISKAYEKFFNKNIEKPILNVTYEINNVKLQQVEYKLDKRQPIEKIIQDTFTKSFDNFLKRYESVKDKVSQGYESLKDSIGSVKNNTKIGINQLKSEVVNFSSNLSKIKDNTLNTLLDTASNFTKTLNEIVEAKKKEQLQKAELKESIKKLVDNLYSNIQDEKIKNNIAIQVEQGLHNKNLSVEESIKSVNSMLKNSDKEQSKNDSKGMER